MVDETSSGRGLRKWAPLLKLAAGLTLLGAAVIHVTQIDIHLEEWAAAGVFFIMLSAAQALLGIGLLMRASGTLSSAAIAVSLIAIAAWVVSRTAGLPFGPEAGAPEPVGRPDSLATLFEAVTTITLVALFRNGPSRAETSLLGSRYLIAAALSASIAGLTVYAIQPVEGCGHHADEPDVTASRERREEETSSRHGKDHRDDHSSDPKARPHKTREDQTDAREEEEC